MASEPRFWNPSASAEPSADLVGLFACPGIRSILDLGCGTGRNLVPFDRPGRALHGVDADPAAVEQTKHRLRDARAETVDITVEDVRWYAPARTFDLVICHGVLHFLHRVGRLTAYESIRSLVAPGGLASVVQFNATVPIPADLEQMMPEPPADSTELATAFSGWEKIRGRSYVYSDEHDGGVRHIHAIDRILVRRPIGYELD